MATADNGYRNFGEGFEKYLKSIENLPLISVEEESRLSSIIKNDPDKKNVDDAIDKLVVANLLLVVKFAINYYNFINKGEFEISIMDLISEANVGLFKAAGTFDSDIGKFSTYASHYIKRYLKNNYYNSRFIRLPINYFTIVNMVKKKLGDRDELPDEELKEIAESQESSLEHVKFVIKCYKGQVCSIDQTSNFDSYDGNDTSNSFMDICPSTEKSLDDVIIEEEDREYLIEKVKSLSDSEQKIIFAKYLGDSGATCQELAEIWGVSKQRISQILIGALKKLRKKIGEDKLLGKDGQNSLK